MPRRAGAPQVLPSAFLRSHFISSPRPGHHYSHPLSCTCRSPAVRTALHVPTSPKAPSVAFYVVEYTFLCGFDSFRAHHSLNNLAIACIPHCGTLWGFSRNQLRARRFRSSTASVFAPDPDAGTSSRSARRRAPTLSEFRRRTESHILRAFRHWFATLVRCALS
jgi:hypothetical protein